VILGAGFSESDRERDSAARRRPTVPTRDDDMIVPFDYPAIVRNVEQNPKINILPMKKIAIQIF